jgi:hypothetical protein
VLRGILVTEFGLYFVCTATRGDIFRSYLEEIGGGTLSRYVAKSLMALYHDATYLVRMQMSTKAACLFHRLHTRICGCVIDSKPVNVYAAVI